MTEVLFYHLEYQSLDRVLPSLLEKTLERGWRAVVESGNDERLQALDSELWTYKEESFLPHCLSGSKGAEQTSIVLCSDNQNINNAQIRFFIDGAEPENISDYERIVILFDGRDQESVEMSRTLWKSYRESDHEPTYWQQGSSGKWEKKA